MTGIDLWLHSYSAICMKICCYFHLPSDNWPEPDVKTRSKPTIWKTSVFGRQIDVAFWSPMSRLKSNVILMSRFCWLYTVENRETSWDLRPCTIIVLSCSLRWENDIHLLINYKFVICLSILALHNQFVWHLWSSNQIMKWSYERIMRVQDRFF